MPAILPSLSRTCLAVGVAAALCTSVACDKRPAPTRPSVTPGDTPPIPPIAPGSTGPIAFASNRNGPTQIFLANADGSLVTRLTEGSHPSWSPDGRRIAFAGPSGGVYVVNADGTGLRLAAANGVQPAWSPDGSRIAYMSGNAMGTGGIFVTDVDGGGARQLVDHALARQLAPGCDCMVERPTWAPDGRSIAFSSSGEYGFGAPSQIFIVNDDGADRRKLVDGKYPTWSPNGPLIAFEYGGISIVGADGSGRYLAVPGTLTGASGWTPNGGLLFHLDRRVFIWEGGAVRQLIPDAEAPAVPGYFDSLAVWSR